MISRFLFIFFFFTSTNGMADENTDAKTDLASVQQSMVDAGTRNVTIFLGAGTVSANNAVTSLLTPQGAPYYYLGKVFLLDFETVKVGTHSERFGVFEELLLQKLWAIRRGLKPIIIARNSPAEGAMKRTFEDGRYPYQTLKTQDPIHALYDLISGGELVETVTINVVDSDKSYNFERLTEILKLLSQSKKRVLVHFVGTKSAEFEKSNLQKFLAIHNLQKDFPHAEFFVSLTDTKYENVRTSAEPMRKWIQEIQFKNVEPESYAVEKFRFESEFSDVEKLRSKLTFADQNVLVAEIVQVEYRTLQKQVKVWIELPPGKSQVPKVSFDFLNGMMNSVPVNNSKLVDNRLVFAFDKFPIEGDFKVVVELSGDQKIELLSEDLRKAPRGKIVELFVSKPAESKVELFMRRMVEAESRANLRLEANKMTLDSDVVSFIAERTVGFSHLLDQALVNRELDTWISKSGITSLEKIELLRKQVGELRDACVKEVKAAEQRTNAWKSAYQRRAAANPR